MDVSSVSQRTFPKKLIGFVLYSVDFWSISILFRIIRIWALRIMQVQMDFCSALNW